MDLKQLRSRTVRIQAVKGNYHTGTPFFLTPVYDARSNRYVLGHEVDGVGDAVAGKVLKALGVDEKNPIENIRKSIHHGMILNLKTDEDLGIYLMAVNNPQVATSTKRVIPDQHLFFVLDMEAESQEDISIERMQFKAKEFLFKASRDVLVKCAIYIGKIDVRGLSIDAITGRLLKEANRDPKGILEFFEKSPVNETFVKELIYYSIIQEKQGIFYDGEKFMGNLPDAVAYISDPKNSEHVNSLGRRLDEIQKS